MSQTTTNGDPIRQAREIRGLTQKALADAVGVDQSTVARWEHGLLAASDEQIESVALATKFPVAFFRRDTGPEFPFGSPTRSMSTTPIPCGPTRSRVSRSLSSVLASQAIGCGGISLTNSGIW
jgi:DNA-binding XRE family transcriptional regulator